MRTHVVNGNSPCSHDVSEVKPGVDYGCDNISQLCDALKLRLENEGWRSVSSETGPYNWSNGFLIVAVKGLGNRSDEQPHNPEVACLGPGIAPKNGLIAGPKSFEGQFRPRWLSQQMLNVWVW